MQPIRPFPRASPVSRASGSSTNRRGPDRSDAGNPRPDMTAEAGGSAMPGEQADPAPDIGIGAEPALPQFVKASIRSMTDRIFRVSRSTR